MNPLKDSFNIIKKRKKTYYFIIALVFLLLFVQAFLAGQHLYRTDKEKAEEIIDIIADSTKIKEIASLFEEGKYVLAGTLIFLNNFLINVFSMYFGIILIVPILILSSNAIVTGMIFGIGSLMPSAPQPYYLFFVSLVGVLEISCLVLVTYEGLRIGMSLVNPGIFGKKKRKDAFKQNIVEGTKVLFLILLLLIIAAIIETFSIALFSSRLIS